MPTNSKKRGVPEPGDPNYKTPTQLRNARKRRKQKQEKSRQQQQQSNNQDRPVDPSLRYLANPKAAPTVQKAIDFFQTKDPDQDFPVFVGPTSGWRTVAKLAVRSLDGCLRIGLFVPGSHSLMEIPQCKAHHRSINSAVAVIQKKCRSLHIQPFEETKGTGNLRHVAINVERATGRQQITLVWKDDEEKDPESDRNSDDDSSRHSNNANRQLDELCQVLIRVSENNDPRLALHSLWVHKNNSWKHANSIFDREGSWQHRYGEKYMEEQLVLEQLEESQQNVPKVPLFFPPQVFRQANLDAFANIIAKIRDWLQDHPHKHCVELYGGVGTIGLNVVDRLQKSLVSSDENPYNKDCFEKSLHEMGVSQNISISYQSKNATQMVESGKLQGADLVIVDPPRKGLDEEVVHALCEETSVQTMVYVSCGFDAFARDYQQLTTDGGWKLQHAEGHVLFPGSDAIETLAVFSRR